MILDHAMERALERYGLKLTHDDVVNMCLQCQVGYGRLSYAGDGKEKHLVECHGKVLVVVYSPPSSVSPKYGMIITVLPRENATSRSPTSISKKAKSRRMKPSLRLPKKNRQRKGY